MWTNISFACGGRPSGQSSRAAFPPSSPRPPDTRSRAQLRPRQRSTTQQPRQCGPGPRKWSRIAVTHDLSIQVAVTRGSPVGQIIYRINNLPLLVKLPGADRVEGSIQRLQARIADRDWLADGEAVKTAALEAGEGLVAVADAVAVGADVVGSDQGGRVRQPEGRRNRLSIRC
jgi:hypothetical protein